MRRGDGGHRSWLAEEQQGSPAEEQQASPAEEQQGSPAEEHQEAECTRNRAHEQHSKAAAQRTASAQQQESEGTHAHAVCRQRVTFCRRGGTALPMAATRAATAKLTYGSPSLCNLSTCLCKSGQDRLGTSCLHSLPGTGCNVQVSGFETFLNWRPIGPKILLCRAKNSHACTGRHTALACQSHRGYEQQK